MLQLFRQAPGFLQTIVLCDETDPCRFVTIDRWENADAYRAFRCAFSQQYSDLDKACESLTLRETLLGSFDEPAV